MERGRFAPAPRGSGRNRRVARGAYGAHVGFLLQRQQQVNVVPQTANSSCEESGTAHRLLVFGNEWGLAELPRQPARPWTFDETLDRLIAAGFDGFQAGAERGLRVLARGLRFAAAGRVSTPAEADGVVARAADAGAEFATVHLGWGDEDDAGIDALVDAVLAASERWRLPVYPETHRATVFQDVWRTTQAIARRPALRFNGDFSHYYCGQEMGYRGFERTRRDLNSILDRVECLHGRVSDGQCMQVSVQDAHNRQHVDNFRWLWRESFRRWRQRAEPGASFPFIPELGPPSSGYAITVPGDAGARVELTDRWAETLVLKAIAETVFKETAT